MGKNRRGIAAVITFIITFLLIYFQAFYAWDKVAADNLCQTLSVPNKNIYVIGIDDKTLKKLGTVESKGREMGEQLVSILNKDKDNAPAVIGFDILYLEDVDEKTDAAFAEACANAGNVVTAMNLQFKEIPKTDANGNIIYDSFNIETADFPYEKLNNSTDSGFVNTIVDSDGYVRRTMAQTEYNDKLLKSFASVIYEKYMSYKGEAALPVKTDKNGQFFFKYTCKSGGYNTVSLSDVLDGTVNTKIFKDAIVLVGAYAVGMQDSFSPAVSHGEQMYGVEIHANIINAMIEGQTQQELSLLMAALILGIIAAICSIIMSRVKIAISSIISITVIAVYIAAAKILYQNGYVAPVLIFPSIIVILYVYTIVQQYIDGILQRRKIIGVFKQYVAPQIVEDISRQKDFKVSLGGEKRHIAVLFVDIRGFTTMSESLLPEEVVEILNEYLALTTDSILKNSGTLDKFIGDATMAVFNAPFDLDDYIFCAVKSAWNMREGAAELSEKFKERFGKSVEFGIGINCGYAVVGNIGCEFRMDYTAIGDTVNTASRLESNAKPGQILISADVYEAVKDRVIAVPVGEISLKGKEKGVFVYQIQGVEQ